MDPHHVFSMFWVITWTTCVVKTIWICQTWWNVKVTEKKEKWRPCRKVKMLYAPSPVNLFHHPISLQNLELWIPQTTEIGVLKFWMQQCSRSFKQLCSKRFLCPWDFSFLYLVCSRLSRIIVDIMSSSSSRLWDSISAMEWWIMVRLHPNAK